MSVERLVAYTVPLTGKRVVWCSGWYQTEDEIHVSEGDWEGLLHELCHWLVARPTERKCPNLALGELNEDIEWEDGEVFAADPEDDARTITREKEACALEYQLALAAGIQPDVLERSSAAGILYDPDCIEVPDHVLMEHWQDCETLVDILNEIATEL